MKHPHATALEAVYSRFTMGDFQSIPALCSEKLTFQVSGKSKLAGKYTSATFAQEFGSKFRELSGGSIKVEMHDILASDLHGTVLLTYKLERDGKTVELRTVHVWRFEGGKPLAGYEYPRDLYQYDAVFA